jgi:hypothetical protein
MAEDFGAAQPHSPHGHRGKKIATVHMTIGWKVLPFLSLCTRGDSENAVVDAVGMLINEGKDLGKRLIN